jgi:hypothetical protein
MWDRIKSYFVFCRAALADDYKHSRWYKKVSDPYTKANLWAGWIFGGTISSLALGYFVWQNWDFFEQNWRWVLVGLLSLFTLFLVWLIGAIKRFHERTVGELTETQKTLLARARRQIDVVWKLSTAFGMAQQASHTVDFFYGSLPMDDLKYLEGNIRQTVDAYFNNDRDSKAAFYKARPKRPEEGDSQIVWVNSYCWGLDKLIEDERRNL